VVPIHRGICRSSKNMSVSSIQHAGTPDTTGKRIQRTQGRATTVAVRRGPGRPSKSMSKVTGVVHFQLQHDIAQLLTPILQTPSATSPKSPTTDLPSQSSSWIDTEDPILKFLRSCKPNLECLHPTFVRIGLKNGMDLKGLLDWSAQEQVAWLMELSKEEWGISRMNVKSLSLALDVAERYETMAVMMGVYPRA
jgi:hypothetical protein